MKGLIIALILLAACIIVAFACPKEQSKPQAVTYESDIRYEVGEKVMASPYGSSWYSGKITGIINKDTYVVSVCGPFDWFGKYKCNTEELRRSSLAKI